MFDENILCCIVLLSKFFILRVPHLPFYDSLPARGHVLVVEHDYLPDAQVLCFQPCLYPMKYLHPRSMYTLARGGTPSAGSGGSIPPAGGKRGFGAKPPKQKLPYKSIL